MPAAKTQPRKKKVAAKNKMASRVAKSRAALSTRLPFKRRLQRKPVVRVARPLPGYVRFTREVLARLWIDRLLFLRLFLVTVAAATLLFGATQQDQYVTTTDALKEYSETLAGEGFNSTVQFGILLATAATGGLNTTLSETQRVYFFFFYLLIWLATIWLLRHRMAGVAVVVRDGLYNAGSPILTCLALFFVATIQLLPMALGIIIYSAAVTSGVLNNGFEVGLFAVGAFGLSVLSLYWVSSTFFALIVASNPGTYPMVALKMANQIVAGQRFKLVARLVWLAALLALLWALVLIPAVLLDSWIAQPLLPIVVLSVQLLVAFSVIFASTYVYLLYRKMIDEPAS
jgi:hypothetical protein